MPSYELLCANLHENSEDATPERDNAVASTTRPAATTGLSRPRGILAILVYVRAEEADDEAPSWMIR